jgi:hypothetical protein
MSNNPFINIWIQWFESKTLLVVIAQCCITMRIRTKLSIRMLRKNLYILKVITMSFFHNNENTLNIYYHKISNYHQ